jgi:dipeptidyl aminopeptidase/acylaminoacyl peptidase
MSIDRLERRLPDVLAELSLPREPDYVDDLLSRTERMSQRPGWTFLERWFPVSTMTDAIAPPRRLPLRPLALLAILVALAAATIVLVVGSQQHLPPPFGLARNGLVVTTNAKGDLITVDPATDAQRTLASGPSICCAQFSQDGQRISYLVSVNPASSPTALRVVNLDGAVVRELAADALKGLDDYNWAPDGHAILLTYGTSAKVLDVATGSLTALDLSGEDLRGAWIGTTGDILFTDRTSENELRVSRLRAGTTTGATEVTRLEYAVDAPKIAPDGSKFLYFVWGTDPGSQGRLHVYDLAKARDVEVSPPQRQGTPEETQWENPVWSPDGTHIAAEVYTAGPNHVEVIPAAGGDPVVVGPEFPTGSGGAVIRFSPDGRSLLLTYRFNQQTWLVPISGGAGRQVSWLVTEDAEWQRLGD